MAKPRNDFLDRLQYVALRVISMTMHCWPIELNHAMARFIGDVMFAFDKRHRDRAMGNLRRSFPEKAECELRLLARRSMEHLIMLGCEVLFTTRLIRLDTITTYVKLEDFSEALSMMLNKGRGVIMLTGHYGNWEILGYALATLGFENTSVARPLDNPYINEYILGVRQRMGQRIIDKKGATGDVIKTLEAGGAVGFIADQNAGPKGIFVDFFGRKASAYKSIGLLAMQYEVPVIVGYTRRLGDRFQFELAAQDVIQPEDWKDEPDPLRYITQRYTTAIEDIVRKDPGQYLWVHRRWKTRPKGEAPEAFD